MATASRYDNQRYKNWLRGTLALQYWKEGVESFLDSQAALFHDGVKKKVGLSLPACGSRCTAKDMVKNVRKRSWSMACPVCNAWLQEIVMCHTDQFPNLCPNNFDPQLWQNNPWEVMKTFMPYGCKHIKHSKDTDVQAALSLFKKCKNLRNLLSKPNLVEELVEIRNNLFHSSTQTVEDVDLHHMHQTMIEFLRHLTGLSRTQDPKNAEAMTNIKKLQNNLMDLSLNKELELKALRQKQEALKQDLEHEQYTIQQKHDALEHDLKEKTDRIQHLKEKTDTLQKEQDCHTTKLKAIDSDLTSQEEIISKLKETNDRFQEFLQKNHLLKDLTKFSTILEDQYERIDLQKQRIDEHDRRILNLEEQGKGKANADSWDESCKDLQYYLLKRYKKKCFWEDPVTNEQQFVADMYVTPTVKLMREKDEHGSLVEVKMEQSQSSRLSYQHIFSSRFGEGTNIYITGDAGTGKTAFCNHLVLTWCNAVQHAQQGTLAGEDLRILSTFRFLFYINLRDTEKIYRVEEMVKKRLMCDFPKSIDISNLLRDEKCLIVLDGLDEWSCPTGVDTCPDLNKNIPGRSIINEQCAFLTTTRNWKYDVSDLTTKDVDKYVELCGIDEISSKELAQKMCAYLNRKSQSEAYVDEFYDEIKGKKLTELITVPVLLIQLITLWHYGKEFGNSQIQLYSSLLDLLFERSKKNLPDKQTESTHTTVEKRKTLPACFSNTSFCQSHTELLLCLAKLAYKSLFNKQKEEALVFKRPTLEIFGISPSDITLCLQCGILSQNKDFGNYAGRYKKFSFFHKKMQEFLAALHIVTFDHVEDMLNDLREICNTLGSMLEMSQVWLFVSGMRSDVTGHILDHLTYVITADTDKQMQNYRQRLSGQGLILAIQTCLTNCISEGDSNGHKYEKMWLNDFYIDKNTLISIEHLLLGNEYTRQDTKYRRNVSRVQRLLPRNVELGIASMYIKTDDMTDDQSTLIAEHLRHTKTLHKLHLVDPQSRIPSKTLTTVVDNCSDCLICLNLLGGYLTYSNNKWRLRGYNITLEHGSVSAICRSISTCLLALSLRGVKLTHGDKAKLMNKLSQSPTIRKLQLVLYCTDHDDKCRPRIDVSAMTQLETIGLWFMCVDNLPTVSECVERVVLVWVTLSMTTLCEFARRISKTKRHVEVKLRDVTVREESVDRVDLESFLRDYPGLKLTHCENRDSNKTWTIDFKTEGKA